MITQAEAKRRIWSALAKTLENDVGDLGANYIYEDPEAEKLEQAALKILKQLKKKARE